MGKKGKKPVPIPWLGVRGGGGAGVSKKKTRRQKDAVAGAPGSHCNQHRRAWSCGSTVHKQAASIVSRLLSADESHSGGATIRGLTLAAQIKEKKATHAVVCQTLKHLPVIRPLVERTQLLDNYPQLTAPIAYVLVYEALFGEGCRPVGGAERAVMKAKPVLQDNLQKLLVDRSAKTVKELLPRAPVDTGDSRPRYVRVNTLKISVEEALKQIKTRYPQVGKVKVDALLPDVLCFPPGTQLHDNPMVKNGCLILQSYGSCMPAHALDPRPSWVVLDACAAPGNKTTHLAALMHGKGKVIAMDRDPKRLKILKANVERVGAKTVTPQQGDFLCVDPESPEYRQVRGILLDPSCSGSGTRVSRMDYLLPSQHDGAKGDADSNLRIQRLAKFQVSALRHALRFPQVIRVVYSTCSINAEENEQVVMAVLPDAQDNGFVIKESFPSWQRRGLPLFEDSELCVRIDPQDDQTDGFFVVVFQRTNAKL